MIEARRNEQISRTILEIPVVYLETDWFQIRCSLVSRGVHPFSLAILDFLDAHVHPQPVELRTHNNYGDEMFKPFPDGTRRRHQDINADLGIARRLLELLDDAPAFFANAKSLSAADEVCFWMDAYRLFWHTILYVVTRIGAGDPRHVKLVCILNELYGICRCPPPSGILSNYNHKVYCDRECFERNVPCQSKIETLFYKKRYLWLWERLVESWNVYEFHAPLFPMVIERERNGNFTEARTWPNNHMFARHVSCIPGEDFAPYAPTNEASVWSVEEWVRLNSFLARFVRLRGTELPFAHVQGGSLYPVLCLKGFYAMIEAFEVSPSAMNLNASLAAIGAASQWILLGRFTQISLAVHAAHLEFSREACPQRYDIRVLRHPQGFGDRYPVNLSPDLISRWEFWVWRLTQIIVSCNDQTPHYVFDLARHARRRIDEDEVEDWTNCITYSGLPICDKLEEETKKKRKEKREERHRQRERQRRRGRQPGSVNAGLEAQADWTVRAHVIKTELTDWRLYNGTHPRKSFNLND
jgi:hypothetical protein